MRKVCCAAAAALVLTAAACAAGSGAIGRRQPPGPAGSSSAGHLGTWRLTGLTARGERVALGDTSAKIVFESSHRVVWDDGSNVTNATYTLAGRRVTLRPGVTTTVGVLDPVGVTMSEAFRAVSAGGSVPMTVRADTLTLSSRRYVLAFARTATRSVDSDSLAGTWRVSGLTDRGDRVGLAPGRVGRWQLGTRGGTIDDGCLTRRLDYTASDGRLRVTRDEQAAGVCAPGSVNLRLMDAVDALASAGSDALVDYAVVDGRLVLTSGRYEITLRRA